MRGNDSKSEFSKTVIGKRYDQGSIIISSNESQGN